MAHQLFRVNDRLTVEQVEKLLVLFNRFEGINGARDRRACELANTVLDSITPETIEQLADKHNIEPIGPRPWLKSLTGGSDDHSGLYIAGAYTTTPPAESVQQFLDHLRAGKHEPAGRHGASLLLAHCFMNGR